MRRIAVLGDSFTVSIALDETEPLPAVLEGLLNARTGQRWEVLNFGVDAFSPAQALLTWRAYAHSFAPDTVVFCLFNGNDISDDDRRLTSYPRPYFSLDGEGALVLQPLPQVWTTGSSWLSEHSRLYVWQRVRVQTLINRWRQGMTRVPGVLRYLDAQPEPLIEDSWVLTEHILAQFATEVQATGASFVLVSIPDLVQVRDDDWQKAVAAADPVTAARLRRDYPEERLGAFARQLGLPFVALLEPLRRAAKEHDIYLSDGHWNEVATRVGAEAVFEVVAGVDRLDAAAGTRTVLPPPQSGTER